EQMGMPGPWHQRLPHFKLEFTPSSGEELQSEYFIPRHYAVDAIMAIYDLREQVGSQILISEIRTIAADELWISPCYQQDCIAIHFTWKQNVPEVTRLLTVIEQALLPFEVRPHWGKLFTLPSDHLHAVHRRMDDFRQLITSYDPDGKFRNQFIDRNIFGVG
ncbi:MAG: FAD-binding protein, partial [Saprospiraceae bacterium]|nr:FAD-binding protein [Saprospiraceae bacterium]